MSAPVQSFRTQRILFLGEQDGPIERELKSALTKCLTANSSIKVAYLARISPAETPGVGVALCLYPAVKSLDDVVQCAAKTFQTIFNPAEHLDILFLSDAQKLEIERVAKPFFRATSS